MFNPDSLQTDADAYGQVIRRGDMSAFDNLPREIRDWMNGNFSHSPAEDILWDYRNKFNFDAAMTLAYYQSLNTEIAEFVRMAA